MCWICLRIMVEGTESKDHLIPKKDRPFGELIDGTKQGPWKWAHKKCNHTRSDLSVEKILEIQQQLNEQYPDGWTQSQIEVRIRAARGLLTRAEKSITDEKKTSTKLKRLGLIPEYQTKLSKANKQGKFRVFRNGKWVFVDKMESKEIEVPVEHYKMNKKTGEYKAKTWKPKKLANGETVWQPE